MNKDDRKIVDEKIKAAIEKLNVLQTLCVRSKKDDEAVLYQLWGNYVNAQTTLLSAYIMAHAFIFLAVIMVSLEFSDKLEAAKSVQFGLFFLICLVCMLGIFLSMQMHYAWQRSRAVVLLVQAHIKQVGEAIPAPHQKITFFENISVLKGNSESRISRFKPVIKNKRVQFGKEVGMKFTFNKDGLLEASSFDNKDFDNEEYDYQLVNGTKNIDRWWAQRAKTLPYLFTIFYVSIVANSLYLFYHS